MDELSTAINKLLQQISSWYIVGDHNVDIILFCFVLLKIDIFSVIETYMGWYYLSIPKLQV